MPMMPDNPCPDLSLRRYAPTAAAHTHGFHQVVLPVRGALALSCSGHHNALMPGAGGLIPSGARHGFDGRNDSLCWVLDVPECAVQGHLFERGEAAFDLDRDSVALALHMVTRPALLDSSVQRRHWAQRLLLRVRRNAVTASPDERRLQRLLAVFEDATARPSDASEIARRSHMSVSTVHRLMRRHLHTSPQRWLLQLRMAEAATQLLAGQSVASVALGCGFADQSAFGKAFKRAHGQSPRQWQHAQRAGRVSGLG